MPRLAIGLALVWAGYTLGYYGFQRIMCGNNTFVQLAWPGKYAIATSDAGTKGAGCGPGLSSPGGNAIPGVKGGSKIGGAPGGANVITPTTPGGLKGVDLNGATYRRTCSTCAWKLYKTATGRKPILQ